MFLQLQTWLFRLFEAFRFIKRARLRAQERLNAQIALAREEREHQRKMLETIFEKMVDLAKANQEGILELARAQQAQADVLATWLKGFQISDPTPQPPTIAHEATDEDEWVEEMMRKYEAGDPDGFPADLPAEFQLAYALNKLKQEASDFS